MLERLELPKGILAIEREAFARCVSLQKIIFADDSSLSHIGKGAFRWTALENIVLPDTLFDIGSGAFANCTNLRSISLGPYLFNFSKKAFWGCMNLRTIEYHRGSRIPRLICEAIVTANLQNQVAILPKEYAGICGRNSQLDSSGAGLDDIRRHLEVLTREIESELTQRKQVGEEI
jgi:hypothetical protein